MYKCDICKRIMPPKTKAHRIPVEHRSVRYQARKEVNQRHIEHKVKWTDDPGGTGFEIVREITACPECAEQHRTNGFQTPS
jgi:hypothetical protein